MTAALPRSLRRRLARLARDRRGIAAVEFAMVLPIMVALYLGGVELSQGIAIDRKTTLVARAVSDLVAQSPNKCLLGTELTAILDASAAVVAPYSSSPLKVVVSHISVKNGAATVTWSEARGGTKRAKNSTVTLPAGLNVDDTAVVLAEASYTYTPTVGYVITGPMTLSDKIYMRPRNQPVLELQPDCTT